MITQITIFFIISKEWPLNTKQRTKWRPVFVDDRFVWSKKLTEDVSAWMFRVTAERIQLCQKFDRVLGALQEITSAQKERLF